MKKLTIAALAALMTFGTPQSVYAYEIDLSGIDWAKIASDAAKSVQGKVDSAVRVGKIMSNPCHVRWGKK